MNVEQHKLMHESASQGLNILSYVEMPTQEFNCKPGSASANNIQVVICENSSADKNCVARRGLFKCVLGSGSFRSGVYMEKKTAKRKVYRGQQLATLHVST